MTNGYIGNKNAEKPADEKSTAQLQLRCKSSDKAVWVRSAQAEKLKLTEWVIKALNAASGL